MNEKSTKRREWVKTAAIIFLSVMLVLTFFSRTIMNYSLPVIAAQYVTSGSISAKVRGTGTIEAGDPYNVELQQTRVISSVAVKKGDAVEKDQVLFYLEDAESQELTEAQANLDAAILAYEQAILSGDISNQVFKNARKGQTSTVETYQNKINAAKKAETDAQAAVDSLKAQINEIDRQLAVMGYTDVDASAEQAALQQAENNLINAQTNLTNAETALANEKGRLRGLQDELEEAKRTIFDYENGITVSGGDPDTAAANDAKYKSAQAQVASLPQLIKSAQNGVNKATTVYNNAVTKVSECEAAKTKAQNALEAKTSNTEASNRLNTQKANLNPLLSAAEVTLANAVEAKTQLITDIQQELKLGADTDTISQLREKVTKLQEDSAGTEIKAPIAGTVTTINYVAGETIKPETPLAVIQPDGKGFSLSFAVTAEQAKRLSVGDPADIQNSWYYSDITATLAQIKNDPENPGKNKILVFDIQGEVTGGQSLSLSIGQKSANYDLIVPNSAIREDNNGKFILTVVTKSSPLGNRYVATRVDVEVLASDDTQSAISGALYGYEYVITTSNKPVEAGKLVRLADE